VLWPLYRRRDFLLMAIDEAHANIAILEAQRRKYVLHSLTLSFPTNAHVFAIIYRAESLVKQAPSLPLTIATTTATSAPITMTENTPASAVASVTAAVVATLTPNKK
jgi:hypothetical protein